MTNALSTTYSFKNNLHVLYIRVYGRTLYRYCKCSAHRKNKIKKNESARARFKVQSREHTKASRVKQRNRCTRPNAIKRRKLVRNSGHCSSNTRNRKSQFQIVYLCYVSNERCSGRAASSTRTNTKFQSRSSLSEFVQRARRSTAV